MDTQQKPDSFDQLSSTRKRKQTPFYVPSTESAQRTQRRKSTTQQRKSTTQKKKLSPPTKSESKKSKSKFSIEPELYNYFNFSGELFDLTLTSYNNSYGRFKIAHSIQNGIQNEINKYIHELEEITLSSKDDKSSKRKIRLDFLNECANYYYLELFFKILLTWLNGGGNGHDNDFRYSQYFNQSLIIVVAGGNIYTIFAELLDNIKNSNNQFDNLTKTNQNIINIIVKINGQIKKGSTFNKIECYKELINILNKKKFNEYFQPMLASIRAYNDEKKYITSFSDFDYNLVPNKNFNYKPISNYFTQKSKSPTQKSKSPTQKSKSPTDNISIIQKLESDYNIYDNFKKKFQSAIQTTNLARVKYENIKKQWDLAKESSDKKFVILVKMNRAFDKLQLAILNENKLKKSLIFEGFTLLRVKSNITCESDKTFYKYNTGQESILKNNCFNAYKYLKHLALEKKEFAQSLDNDADKATDTTKTELKQKAQIANNIADQLNKELDNFKNLIERFTPQQIQAKDINITLDNQLLNTLPKYTYCYNYIQLLLNKKEIITTATQFNINSTINYCINILKNNPEFQKSIYSNNPNLLRLEAIIYYINYVTNSLNNFIESYSPEKPLKKPSYNILCNSFFSLNSIIESDYLLQLSANLINHFILLPSYDTSILFISQIINYLIQNISRYHSLKDNKNCTNHKINNLRYDAVFSSNKEIMNSNNKIKTNIESKLLTPPQGVRVVINSIPSSISPEVEVLNLYDNPSIDEYTFSNFGRLTI